MLVPVPSHLVPQCWGSVVGLISLACERSAKFTVESIRKELEEKALQLWLIVEPDNPLVQCVVVTEILNHPNGRRYCNIRIATGRGGKDWAFHIAEIEEWARQNGCHAMELLTRPGWERVLKDYRKTHVQLEKDL
jgi:hypothetical protein